MRLSSRRVFGGAFSGEMVFLVMHYPKETEETSPVQTGRKKVGIAQIEMIGAKELATERELEFYKY